MHDRQLQFAIATAGSQVYGAQAQGGVYEHFNANGTFTPIPNLQALGLVDNLGMWGDPVNGHLISSSNRGLVDIDPVAGTFRVINGGVFPDGVTVSADGTTVFAEVGGQIESINIATGALIQTYPTGHSPDGIGIISGGTYDGDVVVNNNDGTVGVLDPTTGAFTIIAAGGTRGDFVSPDLTNGTLFVSQEESVDRLSCGPGCSIGSSGPPSAVPEPSTIVLLGSGLIGALVSLRRRQQKR